MAVAATDRDPAHALAAARNLAPTVTPHRALEPLDDDVLGDHEVSLQVNLGELDGCWARLIDPNLAAADVAVTATRALGALKRVIQHSLFLIYLADARQARVGARIAIKDFCAHWNLDEPTDVDEIWQWICADAPSTRFRGEKRLPVVVDSAQNCVYRKPRGFWQQTYTNMAFLYGAGVVFVLLVGLEYLLHETNNLLPKPPSWLAELAVLLLCVIGGALLHVASKALSGISFDDPLSVYEAGEWTDWLALRWLAILRLYIPVLLAAGGLWVTGTRSGSLSDLSIAVLAGYTADSLMLNGLAKVKTAAAKQFPGQSAAQQSGNAAAGDQQQAGAVRVIGAPDAGNPANPAAV